MDKKYRETLPGIIQGLPLGPVSEGENTSLLTAMKKKVRKNRRDKVQKNGLFLDEESNVTKWWLSQERASERKEEMDPEEQRQTALIQQRTRETKLQVILVLETLALEVGAPAQNAETTCNEERYGVENVAEQPKAKSTTKQQDLEVMLELMVDRLCIWQSMNSSPGKVSSKPSTGSKEEGLSQKHRLPASDQLRDFCVDVILPL